MPMVGAASGDYTCIADAMWYGKPVLTNRVGANLHLEDRVIFFDDSQDLQMKLTQLEDEDYYNEVCENTIKAARKKNNMFNLLIELYNNL